MNRIIPGIIAVLFGLLPSASSAETLDPYMVFTYQSALRASIATPAGINGPVSGKAAVVEHSISVYIPDLAEAPHARFRGFLVRSNSFRNEDYHKGMLFAHDSIHTTIYVPVQGVNNVLSLVGTVTQTRVADSVVTMMQALSLIARRQVNTELAYTVPINRNSRIDSAVVYKLHPDSSSGDSEFNASLRYKAWF